MPQSQKLLYLATNWPEPASSAAGSRSLQLLDLFIERDWDITLMCAAEKRPHSATLPQEVKTQSLFLNDSSMDQVFKQLNPDLVIFDRFMLEEQYGWRIENHCPQARRVLDTIDLHSLREIRRTALNAKRAPTPADWFCDTALREIASIYRSDLTLLISDAEMHILCNDLRIPPTNLQVLPFLLTHNEQQLPDKSPSFEARKDFITIGNFRHPPNADAVRYLYDSVWPQLKLSCPDAILKVFGADLPPALQQYHQPQKGFHICGRADNAIEEMRNARVCLAPLRFGAGLKGKLLDAMLGGCPSVTTAIGAEGMQGTCNWPGAVEDDPQAWIDAATRLYQSAEAWQQAQNAIDPLLRERFDRETWAAPFMARIQALISNQRPQTFDQLTGALLRHHQHRSTEYMSRWIETKNMLKPKS